MELTQKQVMEFFEYRNDGVLIRKIPVSGPNGKIGNIVGNYNAKYLGSGYRKYLTTKIFGKHYSIHRIIFLYHYGYMPKNVDHINQNTLDNRIENLREVTRSQSCMNRGLFSNNTSGAKGVYKVRNKWRVIVTYGKSRNNLGYFENFELAELVAIEAREKFHGIYAANN